MRYTFGPLVPGTENRAHSARQRELELAAAPETLCVRFPMYNRQPMLPSTFRLPALSSTPKISMTFEARSVLSDRIVGPTVDFAAVAVFIEVELGPTQISSLDHSHDRLVTIFNIDGSLFLPPYAVSDFQAGSTLPPGRVANMFRLVVYYSRFICV